MAICGSAKIETVRRLLMRRRLYVAAGQPAGSALRSRQDYAGPDGAHDAEEAHAGYHRSESAFSKLPRHRGSARLERRRVPSTERVREDARDTDAAPAGHRQPRPELLRRG